MIIKASQRGGAKQLALHLLNTDDNEHVRVHDIRGFMSDTVLGAFKEAYAVSRATKCKQFLFSVSLNPPETATPGVDVFESAISRIEEKTGLTGHPRAIVFHEKGGRRHAHVVWSRIDAETMTAKRMSHFKLKLRDISRELYFEHNWQMPKGLVNSEERDPRNFTLAEWQQAKRIGLHARDLKQMMQECYAVSDGQAAFAAALQERGMILARGDRRGFVAVTHEGEVLSVSRYVGKKPKEIVAKLGEPDDKLSSVEEAKRQQATAMHQAMNRHLKEAKAKHRQTMKPLEQTRQRMTTQHRQQRQTLEAKLKARRIKEAKQCAARLKSGWRGLWDRLTGHHKQTIKQNEKAAIYAFHRDRRLRHGLIEHHLAERQTLQILIKNARQSFARNVLELREDRSVYRDRTLEIGDPLSRRRRRSRDRDKEVIDTSPLRKAFDRVRQTEPSPKRPRHRNLKRKRDRGHEPDF